MARTKSEIRLKTALIGVRLSPADLKELNREASRRDVTVAQLMREAALTMVRTAS